MNPTTGRTTVNSSQRINHCVPCMTRRIARMPLLNWIRRARTSTGSDSIQANTFLDKPSGAGIRFVHGIESSGRDWIEEEPSEGRGTDCALIGQCGTALYPRLAAEPPVPVND